jgi:hypothetical protein
VPKTKMLKIGAATAAAAVGAVLAITSVFAHNVPSTGSHSVVGNLVKAARAASFPLVANDPALNVFANEQIADAEEAAERAAALAALQQKLAAELAAKQAAAAADPCVAADQAEDAAERAARKAADQAEDAAEAASGVEDPAEDANEKAARQAADKAEDASEAPCAAAEVKAFTKKSSGEHHSLGDRHRH